MNRIPKIYLLTTVVLSIISLCCKKLVDVGIPNNQLVGPIVYNNEKTAAAVMSGVYSSLSSDGSFATGNTSVSLLLGLYSDELIDWSVGNLDQGQFYKMSLNDRNNIISKRWNQFYNTVFLCNSVIEGLSNSSIPKKFKDQLIGEAKFTRALQFFYLVNIWGSVPTPLTPDYSKNSLLARVSVDSVYRTIMSDLLEAVNLLSEDFLNGDLSGSDDLRVRPSKWAALALLSKVYLINGDYNNANNVATQIINSNLFQLEDIEKVFKINSHETIWQIKAEGAGLYNSLEASVFYLVNGIDNSHTVSLDTNLIERFKHNDLRFQKWISAYSDNQNRTFYFPTKYQNYTFYSAPSTEYPIIYRLAEIYLIRAEARAHLDDIGGCGEDINAVRSRAGLEPLTIVDSHSGINSVLNEKRFELFTELGNRWFDLRRTDMFSTYMTEVATRKGASWSDYKALMPIPRAELIKDKNLTQSPGY